MDNEEEVENRELQNEEVMALEAIYPEAFRLDASSPDAYIFTLNLDEDKPELRSPRKVLVRFFLPPTYPSRDMPVYEISSIYCGIRKIDEDMLDAIDAGFQSLFTPTVVVLFEWINWLREYLEQEVEMPTHNDNSNNEDNLSETVAKLDLKSEEKEKEAEDDEIYDYNPEDFKNYNASKSNSFVKAISSEEDEAHDRPTVRSLMGPNGYINETPPDIFSSEPLVDRKSIFVAHVAKVNTVHEVKVVLAHLLQNKKIAKATHNILAYRIMMPDGKVLQDNDDDGESAAGGRLAHLMQILEVENVVVVVTRWFGGIHLGPDRFKDINNVARKTLDELGYINSNHSSKPNKKNKK